MAESPHAYRALEFAAILDRLAGCCHTEGGRQLALELLPSFDRDEIAARLELTAEAERLAGQESVPHFLVAADCRQEARLAAKGAALPGDVLYQIGRVLSVFRQWHTLLQNKAEAYPGLVDLVNRMPQIPRLEQRILESLDGDGELQDTASPELGRLRASKRTLAQRVQDRVHSYVSGKSRDLLSDAVVTMRDGRYVIPLKAEHKGKIKGIVHDTSSSGQTVYIEPEDVLQLGNSLREAEAAERAEAARILAELSSWVGAEGEAIALGYDALAELDLVLAKLELGIQMHGCLPTLVRGHRLFIESGKHPLLDPEIAVPLTLDFATGHDGLLITGPNTGGKTVAIKVVGLFVLMAQSGMMLPAARVQIGPFTQVWADIGDEQSLQQSLSTFSGHIKNIANALRGLQEGGLVLLDEVGAGTDPAEGAALARAILLSIQEAGAKVMASTHYGELKVFAYTVAGFANAAMEFDVKTLRPTYRLMMGAPGASHALRIAERCGLPKKVVERAREATGEQQQEVSAMLERLEVAQKQAQRAQSESDRLAHELKKLQDDTQKKLRQADEARREAKRKAAETMEEALRELRLAAAEIFDELRRRPDQKSFDSAREKLKQIQRSGADFVDKMRPADAPKIVTASFRKGDTVRVVGYSQVGTVLEEPRDGSAMVQVGMVKMRFKIDQLEPTQEAPVAPKATARKSMTLQKAASTSLEIVLIQMRAEEAKNALERFLDDAILSGYPSVRIVHGKGEGILRSMTQEVLRRNRGVRSFHEGEPSEGGAGVTIAVLT